MAEELKSCPFCGQSAYVQEDAGRFYVACTSVDCGCCYGEAWDRDAMPVHQFIDEAEAIAAWNQRTRPAAVDADGVERLEDAVRQAFIEGAEWQKQGRQGRFSDAVLKCIAALTRPQAVVDQLTVAPEHAGKSFAEIAAWEAETGVSALARPAAVDADGVERVSNSAECRHAWHSFIAPNSWGAACPSCGQSLTRPQAVDGVAEIEASLGPKFKHLAPAIAEELRHTAQSRADGEDGL